MSIHNEHHANGERIGPKWENCTLDTIRERAKKLRQIVTLGGEMRYLDLRTVTFKPIEPNEYARYINRDEEPPFLCIVDEINTYHSSGHMFTFKPSIAEVVACIPDTDAYKDVIAFEIVRPPWQVGEIKQSEARQVGFVMARTFLYRRWLGNEDVCYPRLTERGEDSFSYLGASIYGPEVRIIGKAPLVSA